jgi:hypothetical protein
MDVSMCVALQAAYYCQCIAWALTNDFAVAVSIHRMDVSMRVSPEALVGRQLRVYWALDDAWFAGSVEAWDPKTGQHKVRCGPHIVCALGDGLQTACCLA